MTLLAHLESLLAAATRLPWRWSDWSATWGTVERRGFMSTLTGNDPRPPEPQLAEQGRWAGMSIARLEDPIENAADYKLIVAAVNALPALIRIARAAEVWAKASCNRMPQCDPYVGCHDKQCQLTLVEQTLMDALSALSSPKPDGEG